MLFYLDKSYLQAGWRRQKMDTWFLKSAYNLYKKAEVFFFSENLLLI